MSFVIKKKPEPTWFDYKDPEQGFEIKLLIKVQGISDVGKIRKRIKKKVAANVEVDGKERMEIVDDIDTFDLTFTLFNEMLLAWKGIDSDEGVCKEDIIEALFEHEGIRDFVFEKGRAFKSAEMRKEEEKVKN